MNRLTRQPYPDVLVLRGGPPDMSASEVAAVQRRRYRQMQDPLDYYNYSRPPNEQVVSIPRVSGEPMHHIDVVKQEPGIIIPKSEILLPSPG
jgi:hypothetical protein